MTPTMSTPVDKKTRTGRALSANPSQPLNDSVTDQLAAIPDLSRNDLIERWTQAYSRPPPRGLSRRLLEYAAAYQIQARALRGLPPAVRRRLQRIAAAGSSRVTAPARGGAAPALAPGSRLIREWRGRTHTVDVLDSGFRCDGKQYRSLSEIARAITGARWSGPRFFGL